MSKPRCRRFDRGVRLVASAVLNSHVSCMPASRRRRAARRESYRRGSGRWSFEKPRRPRVWSRRAFEVKEADDLHRHDVEHGRRFAPGAATGLLQDVLHAARRKRQSRRPAGPREAPRPATPSCGRDDATRSRRRRRCGSPRASGRRHGPSRRTPNGAARSGTPRAPARTRGCAPSPGAGSRPGSRSPPRRSKASAGPTRRVEIVAASPRSSASSTIAFSAKRARAQEALQLPARLQLVDPPSVATACWRTAAPSRRLSTICR